MRRSAFGLLFLAAAPVFPQQPPPVSESVSVTATLSPEEESALGSATTIITRKKIKESGATTVLELLRTVPGVDIVRQGGDGSVTSVFLRGANSTQTLVLVDGARVNSPFFSGYDFSAVTTENVERIEIVRGPFSALYGSDAIGGVIQIFTRGAAAGFSGQASAEAGSAGQRQGSLFASAGSGPFAVAGSYREARVGGDRPNSDWRERNGSLRLEGRFSDTVRAALEGSILDGETGVPGPVGGQTPAARGFFREERVALPVSFRPAEDNEATVLLARVASKPSFSNPDDPFGFTFSKTNAVTWQARAADTWKTGAHRISAFGSWERWQVDDRSSFGTNLAGEHATLVGGGLQDSFSIGGGWNAAAGLRFDHHSLFGDAWSPRGTISWLSSNARWKLRACAGRAFRAPSVGELLYPFIGNPNLKPERSSSYEVGAERYVPGGRIELSLFWNDLTDLIVYDFAASKNENIGRARTRGAELVLRQAISSVFDLDAGYTYLDAKDRSTGLALLRRPRHRAYLEAVVKPAPRLAVTARATFAGRRADVDALSFARVEDPSYLRYDLFARYELSSLAPYVRLENLTDKRYAEANGYPAPRRRFAAGLEARF